MSNLKSENAYAFTARFLNYYSKLQKINSIELEQDILLNPDWIVIFRK